MTIIESNIDSGVESLFVYWWNDDAFPWLHASFFMLLTGRNSCRVKFGRDELFFRVGAKLIWLLLLDPTNKTFSIYKRNKRVIHLIEE